MDDCCLWLRCTLCLADFVNSRLKFVQASRAGYHAWKLLCLLNIKHDWIPPPPLRRFILTLSWTRFTHDSSSGKSYVVFQHYTFFCKQCGLALSIRRYSVMKLWWIWGALVVSGFLCNLYHMIFFLRVEVKGLYAFNKCFYFYVKLLLTSGLIDKWRLFNITSGPYYKKTLNHTDQGKILNTYRFSKIPL